METALLAADTSAMQDGTQGYEGNAITGFRAAENRVLWTGDAGLGASLDDMIAWERHIDATRDDPDSLYRRATAPTRFADGSEAGYGFGLGRRGELGRQVSGHGGALRGWRSHRLYAPAERVSVVVLFNHMSDAHDAAVDLFAAALGEDRPTRPDSVAPSPDWLGAYLEPETGLSARVEAAADGQILLRYAHPPQQLDVRADGAQDDDGTRLRVRDGGLWMDRPRENHTTRLEPCAGDPVTDIAGRYRCEELDAELTVVDAGGAHYGAFSGFLGQGRMELLEPIGGRVWAAPCARALDHTPPGDWTLAFAGDGDGPTKSVQVGCWLARGLTYTRQT
jgi:D-aminopeptidase